MPGVKELQTANWLDEGRIFAAIEGCGGEDAGRVTEILAKAAELKGLNGDDVAALMAVSSPELTERLFDAAKAVKDAIYGRRVVFFAPLYFSNLCHNECVYCAYRHSNRELKRRVLSQEEIAAETAALVDQGHKRVLLIGGEAASGKDFDYILESIATVYGVKRGKGEIRRLNVNIAPLAIPEFTALKASGIGTYQLFQETYHRETYKAVHVGGRKTDFDWRVSAIDRAMEAGIDDVGLGPLLGLYDWRFETLALMQHIAHLEDAFGVGCHTISVPRMEPAVGSDMASHPPHAVSDADFKKLVAILRLAVPYTGIILSTREGPEMRRAAFDLGVSQISGGSRTNPGGYTDEIHEDAAQFLLGDHRPLDEVIRDVAALGYTPSFCTACYRLGRTGADFMDLAKPGLIRTHCAPNALSTFLEYLIDYATPETVAAGEARIAAELADLDPQVRTIAERMMAKVRAGERDVFC